MSYGVTRMSWTLAVRGRTAPFFFLCWVVVHLVGWLVSEQAEEVEEDEKASAEGSVGSGQE